MALAFDFIIIGAGTSGCLLANRLVNARTRPSVLLIEAGGRPEGDTLRAPFHRWTPAFTRPDLDHGYSTVPQKELNDRCIPYARGKGLGGSSILNFAVYLYGSKEDYNRWAELVGDDSWRWEETKERFKRIENYDTSTAHKYSKYADPRAEDHGQEGTVDISIPVDLEKGSEAYLDALLNLGHPLNLDLNSGNPIGVGVFPSSYSRQGRTTSATAHLESPPSNLTIWTENKVARLLKNGKKIVGVEVDDGRKASSFKDVIVSAGALDTPKLLLLNGIGPAAELKAHGIEVVHDLSGVGKNLRDHILAFICAEVDTDLTERYAFESNADSVRDAQQLWNESRSGPMAHHNGTLAGGFFKDPHLEEYPEFQALPKDIQQYLSKPTVPASEITGCAALFPPGSQLSPNSGYLSIVTFLMNPQSEGEVTLRSANPQDTPVIDFKYMEHPYDRKVMTEAVRNTVDFFQDSDLKKHIKRFVFAPESRSHEDVQKFLKDAVGTVWHAHGTAKMGRPDDPMACVDTAFRVFGVEGLRVVDLSVAPVTTNNHTQPTAYLIGQKAAEVMIKEYGL
ncbi:alcohol oxidase [Mytilinidion resinicola]|uniref:Alcohol oxidase n=1 Tax=Mytilinidion resinicola TaxID=574789 RepID=A0A6A6ZA13_9PEZI|nr:alcohol oxidase [Mytilinidion resinicola]KAF2817124.1 alcohol oxidase [Mytilinidion resinicola]